MKKLEIEIKGQRYFGAVAKSGATTWYSLNGEVWAIETEVRSGRAGARTASDPTMVCAPMPGKIIKVLVQINSKVVAGDTLVVMEAMKMEYTLKAAVDGIVESISCIVGQQVALGATLVNLRTE